MRPSAAFAVCLLLPLAAFGQESVRDLSGPGKFTKYLTPGQLDQWNFEGEKGETIIAHVATRDFDSILSLAAKGAKEDKLLFPEVDDEGSDSRFSFRLPEKGQYKIRVHAFKYQGGGNYELNVRLFMTKPLQLGQPVVGTLDHEGKSYFFFQATKDRILTTDLKGPAVDAWKMLDDKGREMAGWLGVMTIEEEGEHNVEVSGRPGMRYELIVREARRRDLGIGRSVSDQIPQGQMEVWSFMGKPGDFRLLEIDKRGELAARLVYAPLDKNPEKQLAQDRDWPEIRFVPVASRGGRVRFAAFLGREGRYQLHLLAQTDVSIKLDATDPTVLLGKNGDANGILPVGGTAFYGLKVLPGQLVQAGLTSQQFVPLLRLYDCRGNLLASSDADDSMLSRITHMTTQEGLYRLQVSSLGDGGGGNFRLAVQQVKLKEVAVGGRGQGAIEPGGTDFWSFTGNGGQTLFVNLRSAVCEPVASLRSPDGVELASDDRGNAITGSLMALKLPKTGRYTIWIRSRRGAGPYSLRLIDGD
jgi:hypothetical protein